MTNLDELLRTSTPYRPRIRSDMPLLEWVEEYNKSGYVTIPVYISSKKDENPEGHKMSKLRTTLFNGYTNMPQNERTLVQETFNSAFYCLITDADNLRQCVVLNAGLKSVFHKAGNAVKPLLASTPNPKGSKEDKTAPPTASVQDKSGQAVATAQPDKKAKSKKKQANK